MRSSLLLLFVFCMTLVRGQDSFEKENAVKNLKVTVKVLNQTLTVLVPDDNASGRYISSQLPEELKKDGLHLTVDGEVGKIPANVRMAGTPFRITCIKISRAEAQKFKLAKKRYCLKP